MARDVEADDPTVGTILVEVLLDEDGAYPVLSIDGLNTWEALGYLRPALADLEAQACSGLVIEGDAEEEDEG